MTFQKPYDMYDLKDLLSMQEELKIEIESIVTDVNTRLSEVLDTFNTMNRAIIQIMETSISQDDETGRDQKRLLRPDISDEREQKVFDALLYYPENEASAEEIAKTLNKHRSTVSQYLNKMTEQNLIKKYRKGHVVYFSVSPQGYRDQVAAPEPKLSLNENTSKGIESTHDKKRNKNGMIRKNTPSNQVNHRDRHGSC